jgi:hypothetical protein
VEGCCKQGNGLSCYVIRGNFLTSLMSVRLSRTWHRGTYLFFFCAVRVLFSSSEGTQYCAYSFVINSCMNTLFSALPYILIFCARNNIYGTHI